MAFLKEAYEATDTRFFSDSGKGGVLGTLDGLGAAQASSGEGTSVAAHTKHLRWSLANINATVRGMPWNPNWGESWQVRGVDQGQWDRPNADLRREYASLQDSILAMPEKLEPLILTSTIATMAHAAYHLVRYGR